MAVGIKLVAAVQGQYTVSSKVKRGRTVPVIDLNSREALGSIAGETVVRAVIRVDGVYLLPLASEQAKRERLSRLRHKLQSGQPLLVASLAHGGGVLSHAAHSGLQSAGLCAELAVFNEIDEGYALQSIACNSAVGDATAALCMPMQELVQDEWAMGQLPRVEVLEMGLPCSGASKAGKSKLALPMMECHPHVGHLVFSALAIVQKLQPVVIVLENVVDYSHSASAQILRQQLADMGYQVREHVLAARDYGSLENRVRWALVATTAGVGTVDLLKPAPAPENGPCLGDLLDDIALDSDAWSELTYLREKEGRDLEAGKGFAMQIVTPASKSVPTIRKQYNKGGSTDPYVQHPQNPRLLRKFTVAEHARIKGVPVELVDGLAATTAHELLGQGIAYAPFEELFKALGYAIAAATKSFESAADTLTGWRQEVGMSVG
jgi:DNA (cytosine-5)-methyltransferase 1